MRLRLSLALLVILLVPAASAWASGRDVLRDCADDEVLSKAYTQKEYRDALSELATDSSRVLRLRERHPPRPARAGRGARQEAIGWRRHDDDARRRLDRRRLHGLQRRDPRAGGLDAHPGARGARHRSARGAEPGGAPGARRGAHRRRRGHPGLRPGGGAARLVARAEPHRLELAARTHHRVAHPPRRRADHRDRRPGADPCPGSPNRLVPRSSRRARARPWSSRRPSRPRATRGSTSRSRCSSRRRCAPCARSPTAACASGRRRRPRSASSSPPERSSPPRSSPPRRASACTAPCRSPRCSSSRRSPRGR